MRKEQKFDIIRKIALITGSKGGLGSVLIKSLAENGATVLLNGRRHEKVDA